ncbi:MAG: C-type lectin domain-containing protein [Synergistaceae bacterium]|nr:C-type lectin domain-containing protein [Synergistaceae bacterium]
MSYLDEFLKKYHAPSVNDITVGFSGIDPSPIVSSSTSLTEEEITRLIALYLSRLKVRVDSGNVVPDAEEPEVPADVGSVVLPEEIDMTCDGKCRKNCSFYDGHWFKCFDELKTWHEAKAACEALGGHLATSTSAEKNEFLADLVGKAEATLGGNRQVWLGATDEEREGTWKWVTGEDWNYTNWRTGQPDNAGGKEHYLHFNWGERGKWNDYLPTVRLGYVCECDAVLHEALPDLMGGNANGHYHLTLDELSKLYMLIRELIPAGRVVIPPSGTDDHEELNSLLGGDSTGHYHFNADEWHKIKTLITTTFPPGSTTPVFPGSPTNPNIPDVPLPDYSAMFAGKAPQWGKSSIPGSYKSAADGGRMYSGTIAITSSPYVFPALVMPMTYKNSSTKVKLMYTTDLTSWKLLRDLTIKSHGSSLGELVYGHISPTSKLKARSEAKAHFIFYASYAGTSKAVYYKSAGTGSSIHNPSTNASGYLAGDYSPDGRKFVLSNGNGNIVVVSYKKDTSTAVILQVTDKGATIGMSVNPGCLKYGKGIYCATGPNGTAQSADGANWTVNNNAPKDMIGLAYREDWTYTDSNGASFTGAFLACSRDTRVFYYSGDGKNWTQCSTVRIPLEGVSGVAYSPERQEYCAVGMPGNVACISKDLVTWTPTYVSVADITASDVVWASFAGKFVLMPNSSNDFYTYPQ